MNSSERTVATQNSNCAALLWLVDVIGWTDPSAVRRGERLAYVLFAIVRYKINFNKTFDCPRMNNWFRRKI